VAVQRNVAETWTDATARVGVQIWSMNTTTTNKKRPERCKHCALAVVRRSQKFSPCCRPHSRWRRTAKI